MKISLLFALKHIKSDHKSGFVKTATILSVFGLSINDKSMQDQSLRGQIYESTGLHYYMLKNGYWLTPGLTGVCSTIMDHSDVDPFCQTLLEGIKILRS